MLAIILVISLICGRTLSDSINHNSSNAAENGGQNSLHGGEEGTKYTNTIFAARNDVMTCPYSCVCSPQPSPTISGLSIDCKGRTGNVSSLPAEIDALLSALDARLVTSLSIVNSMLTSLPVSVCRLVNLENLLLDGNQLIALPEDCFTRMRGLKMLSASNNKIRELQDGLFVNLQSLTSLRLSNNELSYIGPHMFDVTANLTSLSTIDLQFNRLTSLDPWPVVRGKLVPGSTILLGNNLIENFTNDIGWSHRCGQPSVKLTLDLRWNLIRHAADITLGWNVTGDNPIMDVICALGFLDSHRQLCRLILDNNQFVCDCWDYTLITVLRQFHFVHWLDNNNCANMAYKKMTEVKLEELVCDVHDPLCPPGCSCIKRPYNSTLLVNCPGSKMIDLPHIFPPLDQQRVRFDTREKYEIRNIDGSLGRLELRDYLIKDTVKLDVSGSAIETVSDEAWLALRNVRHIDLSHNKITTLSHVLRTENDSFSFKVIALHGNPLRCHCEDAWIRTWMLSLGTRLQEPDSVRCGSPYWMEGTIIGNIVDDELFCQMDPAVLYFLKEQHVPA